MEKKWIYRVKCSANAHHGDECTIFYIKWAVRMQVYELIVVFDWLLTISSERVLVVLTVQ